MKYCTTRCAVARRRSRTLSSYVELRLRSLRRPQSRLAHVRVATVHETAQPMDAIAGMPRGGSRKGGMHTTRRQMDGRLSSPRPRGRAYAAAKPAGSDTCSNQAPDAAAPLHIHGPLDATFHLPLVRLLLVVVARKVQRRRLPRRRGVFGASHSLGLISRRGAFSARGGRPTSTLRCVTGSGDGSTERSVTSCCRRAETVFPFGSMWCHITSERM